MEDIGISLSELLDALFQDPRPVNEGSPKRIGAITFFILTCQTVVQEKMGVEEKDEEEYKKLRHTFAENMADAFMNLGVTLEELNYVLDDVLPAMERKQDEARWSPDLEKEG